MSSEINSRYYHKSRQHEPILWKTENSQEQEKKRNSYFDTIIQLSYKKVII